MCSSLSPASDVLLLNAYPEDALKKDMGLRSTTFRTQNRPSPRGHHCSLSEKESFRKVQYDMAEARKTIKTITKSNRGHIHPEAAFVRSVGASKRLLVKIFFFPKR